MGVFWSDGYVDAGNTKFSCRVAVVFLQIEAADLHYDLLNVDDTQGAFRENKVGKSGICNVC